MLKVENNDEVSVNGGVYKLIDPLGSCYCDSFDAKFLKDSLGNDYSSEELKAMKNDCQFCKHMKNIRGEENIPLIYCGLSNRLS